MIRVYWIVRPRHSKHEFAPRLCRDYSGTLGYEAVLRYSVAPETGQGQYRVRKQRWLRQEFTFQHGFYDEPGSQCGQSGVVGGVEYFRIDPNGWTGRDIHFAVWDGDFGSPCLEACRQSGYFLGELRVVYLHDRGATDVDREPGASTVGDRTDYRCDQATERGWRRRPDGSTAARPDQALGDCPGAPPVDPDGEDELERVYGTAQYSYTYQINHCETSWINGTAHLMAGPRNTPDIRCEAPTGTQPPGGPVNVGTNGWQTPGYPGGVPWNRNEIRDWPFSTSLVGGIGAAAATVSQKFPVLSAPISGAALRALWRRGAKSGAARSSWLERRLGAQGDVIR